MKKLCISILLTAAALALFTACSKSDDGHDLRGQENALAGIWQLTNEYWVYYENGKYVDSDNDPYDGRFTLELTENGRYHWYDRDIPSDEEGNYWYNVSNHRLELSNGVSFFGSQVVGTVTRLTENRLELSWIAEEFNSDGHCKYDSIISFKRIE